MFRSGAPTTPHERYTVSNVVRRPSHPKLTPTLIAYNRYQRRRAKKRQRARQICDETTVTPCKTHIIIIRIQMSRSNVDHLIGYVIGSNGIDVDMLTTSHSRGACETLEVSCRVFGIPLGTHQSAEGVSHPPTFLDDTTSTIFVTLCLQVWKLCLVCSNQLPITRRT